MNENNKKIKSRKNAKNHNLNEMNKNEEYIEKTHKISNILLTILFPNIENLVFNFKK